MRGEDKAAAAELSAVAVAVAVVIFRGLNDVTCACLTNGVVGANAITCTAPTNWSAHKIIFIMSECGSGRDTRLFKRRLRASKGGTGRSVVEDVGCWLFTSVRLS